MAGEMKGEGLLEGPDVFEASLVARLREPVERGVRALHVGGVVLVVVELHDPGRDVRLERAEVVAKLRKRVGGHCAFLPLVVGPFGLGSVRTHGDR